jgi:phosphoglucomutase
VLAANGVETPHPAAATGVTPTPAVSHAILTWNRGRTDRAWPTASSSRRRTTRPRIGGFKYRVSSPDGGPADTDVTGWIQNRANAIVQGGRRGPSRRPCRRARRANHVVAYNYVTPFVADLGAVIDFDIIREKGIRIRRRPPRRRVPALLVARSGKHYGINITVVNPAVDPAFSFMSVDHDGKIRMDCSSPYAMASLVRLKDDFDIAWGCDPDSDRHGIVTPSSGLLNPNHYLAVAISYLLQNRPDWKPTAIVGKTLVSSSLIDKVVGWP